MARAQPLLLPLLGLALLAGCARGPGGPPAAPGEGVPIEVARFWDVRGGRGVAAPSPTWFQRRMVLALTREGFAPKALAFEEPPSGEGLSVTGRLEELPSTVERDGPPGEVSFRVEVRRGPELLLARSYTNRVWLGWPQMAEWGTAESALREATDRALADFAREVKQLAQGPPPALP